MKLSLSLLSINFLKLNFISFYFHKFYLIFKQIIMKNSSHLLDYEEEEMFDENEDIMQIQSEELRKLVDEHLQSGDTQTAAFWAEKLLAIDPGDSLNQRLPQIAHYLSVLTAARSWQTIITLIERHDLFLKHIVFAFFYVNALFNREMFSGIIALPIGQFCKWDDVPFIGSENSAYICAQNDAIRDPVIKEKLDELMTKCKFEASLLFLLSKTYLMVQNRPAAAGCLRHCLNSNPYCSEAMHLAIDSRLLKANEIQDIISSSSAATNQSGNKIIANLLEIYDLNREPPKTLKTTQLGQINSNDLSFQSAYAFRLYSRGCIQEACKITSTIMHEFGYYSKCFLVHIGCLVHLNKISELYQLGHSMVKLQPEREITWYTVGCYYYATGQYTTAKKFLNKCTLMNSGFGEGWLAYGHTLFYVEEHEQAMNCYLRASRILEGHFEPLLYIAVEYCFANNYKLATDFMHDAEIVAGANAIVLHEQGTVAYMEHEFKKAEQIFMEAIRLITRRNSTDTLDYILSMEINDFWEPLFNNLGHTLRKRGKFEQAILVHRKSLLLGSAKAEAWACIGICYAHLIGECGTTGFDGADENGGTKNIISTYIDASVDALNKSLALKPGMGDEHVKTSLEKVLQFASNRNLQKRFPLELAPSKPDENLDAVIERYKQKGGTKYHQQQQQRRSRRTPASRGLDKLDPNTSGIGGMDEDEAEDGASSEATIGLPASCSSPMLGGPQRRGNVPPSIAAATLPSPIFTSYSKALP